MGLVISTKKDEVFEYIPISCRGDDVPFTVKIKRIDPKTFAKLEDGLTKINQEDATISFASGSFNWNVAKRGIVGWENVSDDNGTAVKFKKDQTNLMDDSVLELIPMEMVTEIATTISSITRNPEHTDLFLGKSEASDVKSDS